ncbi:MAG: hypothetical protein PSX37_07665 [bacterium]|nr:hypothetical protein [bacterium]
MESLKSLRARLLASRPESWNLGYPQACRDRVAAYAIARQSAGIGIDAIATELGISRHSVVAWSRSRSGSMVKAPLQFVPVELAAEPPPPEQARRPSFVNVVAASPGRPVGVLVTPRGFRVEGLDLDALGALLERLG